MKDDLIRMIHEYIVTEGTKPSRIEMSPDYICDLMNDCNYSDVTFIDGDKPVFFGIPIKPIGDKGNWLELGETLPDGSSERCAYDKLGLAPYRMGAFG